MSEERRPDLDRFLDTLQTIPEHWPCLLIVHPEIGRLAQAVCEVSGTYGWPHLSLGGELASALLPEPVPYRPRAARRWVSDRLGGMWPGPVLCTEVDLLFEPSLELDPLALFCDAGRATRLVVAWPGSYAGGVLAYAVPEHAHPAQELPFADLLRLPELFPFRFTLGVDDLRAHPWFAVQRQGSGWDMVRLKKR